MSKKTCIIILHGWKLSGSRYNECVSILRKAGYKTFAPDLPGFGKEPLKSPNMRLDDYVRFLEHFLDKEKIQRFVLVGHSFGGRVAIKYAYKNPAKVSKLILTGVPIVRHINFRQRLALVLSKAGNLLSSLLPTAAFDSLRKLLYHIAGSLDYYKAGPMSRVFVNIISEDLTTYARGIQVPTYLLWGENDQLVPVADLEIIKKYIPRAISVVFPGEDHKLPYEKPVQFSKEILRLLDQ